MNLKYIYILKFIGKAWAQNSTRTYLNERCVALIVLAGLISFTAILTSHLVLYTIETETYATAVRTIRVYLGI